MSLVISGSILNLITVKSHGLYGALLVIPVVCLGAYGVFKESRTVLVIYIVHSVRDILTVIHEPIFIFKSGFFFRVSPWACG